MRDRRRSPGAQGGELDLLRQIRWRAALGVRGPELRLGIGDDCALLGVRPGEELAVTTDLSIDGRHFRIDQHPPESIGHRSLARGLSDLASMGARPVAAFLSLGLPPELTKAVGRADSWLDRFFDGFFRLARDHKTPLAGGDLGESPITVADVVLIGAVPAGTALRRSVACPGDLLYVTGSLGGAAANLPSVSEPVLKRKGGRISPAQKAHFFPEPRVPQGLVLHRRGLAAAAIDLSDGLSTDLMHLCEESGVGATIYTELLPIAEGATLKQALHGGEDYELLFAARPGIRMPRSIASVPITRIGELTRSKSHPSVVIVTSGGKAEPLESDGWEHFAKRR